MKLRITISKYHLWYLCEMSLQIMLLPIQIRSTESKCTLKNSKLLKVFLVLQYHRDEAFHFPGKFHFLVKTITDSDRLGLVYLNLLFSTANGVIFCEIYLQSAAHITSDPRFIYLFILFSSSF